MSGMRFWLRCKVFPYGGAPQYWANDPYVCPVTKKSGNPSRKYFPRIFYKGKKLVIEGQAIIDDPSVIRQLLKDRTAGLMFDPQDAVDKGFLPADEVRAMGYQNIKDRPDVETKEATVEPDVIPDFGTWEASRIRTWANEHGIFIDSRLGKDKAKAFVLNALKEKENTK